MPRVMARGPAGALLRGRAPNGAALAAATLAAACAESCGCDADPGPTDPCCEILRAYLRAEPTTPPAPAGWQALGHALSVSLEWSHTVTTPDGSTIGAGSASVTIPAGLLRWQTPCAIEGSTGEGAIRAALAVRSDAFPGDDPLFETLDALGPAGSMSLSVPGCETEADLYVISARIRCPYSDLGPGVHGPSGIVEVGFGVPGSTDNAMLIRAYWTGAGESYAVLGASIATDPGCFEVGELLGSYFECARNDEAAQGFGVFSGAATRVVSLDDYESEQTMAASLSLDPAAPRCPGAPTYAGRDCGNGIPCVGPDGHPWPCECEEDPTLPQCQPVGDDECCAPDNAAATNGWHFERFGETIFRVVASWRLVHRKILSDCSWYIDEYYEADIDLSIPVGGACFDRTVQLINRDGESHFASTRHYRAGPSDPWFSAPHWARLSATLGDTVDLRLGVRTDYSGHTSASAWDLFDLRLEQSTHTLLGSVSRRFFADPPIADSNFGVRRAERYGPDGPGGPWWTGGLITALGQTRRAPPSSCGPTRPREWSNNIVLSASAAPSGRCGSGSSMLAAGTPRAPRALAAIHPETRRALGAGPGAGVALEDLSPQARAILAQQQHPCTTCEGAPR